MSRASHLATVLVGAALEVVAACSDDSPGSADAASCACPAAEPPLAGRIIRVNGTVTIEPNGYGIQGSLCPAGGILLGGSCRLDASNPGVHLNEAGIGNLGGQIYQCEWSSQSPIAAVGVVDAICLAPSP